MGYLAVPAILIVVFGAVLLHLATLTEPGLALVTTAASGTVATLVMSLCDRDPF
jgi:hypothetical protein